MLACSKIFFIVKISKTNFLFKSFRLKLSEYSKNLNFTPVKRFEYVHFMDLTRNICPGANFI